MPHNFKNGGLATRDYVKAVSVNIASNTTNIVTNTTNIATNTTNVATNTTNIATNARKVVVVTANTTVTTSQTETLFLINMGESSFTMTLPTPTAGLYYRFVLENIDTSAVPVTTGNSAINMFGAYDNGGTPGAIPSDTSRATFTGSGVLSQDGDYLEFTGLDSTNWYVTGLAVNVGGITYQETA